MKAWKRILMIGMVICLLIGCTTMIMPQAAESTGVITLDSAQLIYNGWHNKKIRLTFSDKVSIPADGSNIYLASSVAGGDCSADDGSWQSHSRNNIVKGYIEYLDGEVVGGKTYASVIDLYFDHCCSTHKSLWADYKKNVIPEGAVVYLNEAANTDKFVGLNGEPIKTTSGTKAHVALTAYPDPIEDGVYTIANVSTGNSISVDGDKEIKLVKASDQGDGIYIVTTADGTTPIALVPDQWQTYYPATASDTQYVRVVDCGNSQYRLLGHIPSSSKGNRFSKTMAYDDGSGTADQAALNIQHLDTNFANPDGAEYKPELASNYTEKSLWTLTKQVEFESAELLYANAYYKKIRLTFSDKVAIPENGSGIYLAYSAEANGCSGTTDNKCLSRPLKEGSEKGHFEYVDGVEKDGVMYASVIDMHFRRCVNSNSKTYHESLWDTTYQYNTIPEGAEVRLTGLDTAGYVGIDGGAVLPTTGTKAVVPLTYASSPIENGTYNIMNCDTGRSFMVGTEDELTFTLQSDLGKNIYKVTNGNGDRVDVNTSYGSTYSPSINGATETYIRVVDCGNDRYQLFVYIPSMSNRLGATYILDSGSGDTNAAVLQNYHVDDASLIMDTRCLWYLTKEGDTRPLKVMPLGDSITAGVNDDITDATQKVGYRAQLSAALIEKYGRVVFVGENVTTYDAGLSSKRLLRHAGYPGAVINDVWDDDKTPTQLTDKIELNLTKFKPDLVLMQMGTNDISYIYNNNGKDNIADEVKQSALDELLVHYGNLVQSIESTLNDNGLLLCSTVTPRIPCTNNDARIVMVNEFNEMITSYVGQQAEAGKKMALVDNFTAVNALGEDGICTDHVHVSQAGSVVMANTYLKAITAQYDADSIKKNNVQGQLAKAKAGDTVALTANVVTGSVGIPLDVTLDLNGHVLAADEVFGITSTSYLVDSKDGLGGLKIEKDNLSFIGENEQMPLYDATIGGYRFFDFELEYQTRETTETMVKYGIRLDLPSEQAYALLDDADNCKTVRILLTLTKEGVTPKNIDYAFRTETVEDYVSKSSADLNKKYGLMLTVSGLDAAEAEGYSLSATAQLEMPGYIVGQAY